MSRFNQILAVSALVLLAASVLTYRRGVIQGDRFERGQRFLPQLDVDQVSSVAITVGEDSLTLNRSGDQFVIEDSHDYPARNDAVNRLFRDLLDLALEQEIGSGDESLLKELGLIDGGEETVLIALQGRSGEEMVRFRLGKNAEDGSGRYIRRESAQEGKDAPIYVTSERFEVQATPESYLRTEILDEPKSRIQRIEGSDFVFEKPEGGELALQEVPSGQREKQIEVNKVTGALTRLVFDKVFLADDPQVQALAFRPALRILLDDSTGYLLEAASRGEEHFLRIAAFHTVDRVEISRDESEEELKEKAEMLTRVDETKEFNDFHGSWVYQVSDYVGGKMSLQKADLMEKESS